MRRIFTTGEKQCRATAIQRHPRHGFRTAAFNRRKLVNHEAEHAFRQTLIISAISLIVLAILNRTIIVMVRGQSVLLFRLFS